MGLLATILVLSGISVSLAGLVVLADKFINNYSEVEIDVNDGKKKFKTKGGSSLLSSLAEGKIFVPSACGGKGSCGLCKVKVLSDVGPILPTEAPYLSKDEIAQNVRLSCQIKVKKSLKVWLPEHLFAISEYRSKVEKIVDLTYDIKEITLRLIDPPTIEFKAGQYIQLIIPPYGDVKEPVMRAYSMSSQPSMKDRIELIIRKVPGGLATTYIHEHLKVGEELRFIGPFGEFYLRESNSKIIAIAGGSGMAPIRSIILDMYEKKIERETYFFFGARSKRDLFYVDFFKNLEKLYPSFHFISALSEPKPEDNWDGEVGLITQVVEKYLDRFSPDQVEAYLCGSPGMINASIEVLKKFGLKEEKIFYDKFA
jgi:Na+-transporting NADH:ubiquinone oxidoreductase subunit F